MQCLTSSGNSMTLKRSKHDTPAAVEDEFKNLDETKEEAFVWMATRAPTTSDKNHRVWVFKDGSALKLYLYDRTSGVWRGPTTFS